MVDRTGPSVPCPQYLHRPFQVYWFETDELGIGLAGLTLAFLFDSFLLVGVAILVMLGYCRAKKTYPRGFLKHFFYLLGFVRFRAYPNPMVTRYQE